MYTPALDVARELATLWIVLVVLLAVLDVGCTGGAGARRAAWVTRRGGCWSLGDLAAFGLGVDAVREERVGSCHRAVEVEEGGINDQMITSTTASSQFAITPATSTRHRRLQHRVAGIPGTTFNVQHPCDRNTRPTEGVNVLRPRMLLRIGILPTKLLDAAVQRVKITPAGLRAFRITSIRAPNASARPRFFLHFGRSRGPLSVYSRCHHLINIHASRESRYAIAATYAPRCAAPEFFIAFLDFPWTAQRVRIARRCIKINSSSPHAPQRNATVAPPYIIIRFLLLPPPSRRVSNALRVVAFTLPALNALSHVNFGFGLPASAVAERLGVPASWVYLAFTPLPSGQRPRKTVRFALPPAAIAPSHHERARQYSNFGFRVPATEFTFAPRPRHLDFSILGFPQYFSFGFKHPASEYMASTTPYEASAPVACGHHRRTHSTPLPPPFSIVFVAIPTLYVKDDPASAHNLPPALATPPAPTSPSSSTNLLPRLCRSMCSCHQRIPANLAKTELSTVRSQLKQRPGRDVCDDHDDHDAKRIGRATLGEWRARVGLHAARVPRLEPGYLDAAPWTGMPHIRTRPRIRGRCACAASDVGPQVELISLLTPAPIQDETFSTTPAPLAPAPQVPTRAPRFPRGGDSYDRPSRGAAGSLHTSRNGRFPSLESRSRRARTTAASWTHAAQVPQSARHLLPSQCADVLSRSAAQRCAEIASDARPRSRRAGRGARGFASDGERRKKARARRLPGNRESRLGRDDELAVEDDSEWDEGTSTLAVPEVL
ncbi:hypothetical protein DFH09DRAFT_1444956 [Mycena vulgaris]|nr:hypothetical protein DFH09DRAFT_1444956 [Mycena vulgaris]